MEIKYTGVDARQFGFPGVVEPGQVVTLPDEFFEVVTTPATSSTPPPVEGAAVEVPIEAASAATPEA